MKGIYSYLIMLAIIHSCFYGAAQRPKHRENLVTIMNNGWQLKGDLILVSGKSKSPVVLLFNKANGDRKVYKELAAQLANDGISSLRIDLRGHGESINKGKFIPFDSLNNLKLDLDNGYTDIIAAHKYLLTIKQIDSNRIGMVGASYSGEDMMVASRNFKMVKMYVALSPGSFSAASISTIDSCLTPFLFIKSNDERSMQGFEKELFLKSKKAKVMTVPGKIHATDILQTYPEMNGFIADWFKSQL